MKLHPARSDQTHMVLIDDCDHDGPEITYYASREAAEAFALAQYDGIPDATEEGGERYLDEERPNATVLVCQVVARTRL